MASVILNSTAKSSNLANGAQLQINYSTSYNATTNKTTLTVDSVLIKNTSITLQMKIHGQLVCNGLVIVDWENANTQLTDEEWVTVTSGTRYSIELEHSATGALTLTFAPKTKDTTYPNYGGVSDGVYIGGNLGSNYYFKFGESATATADASQSRRYSLTINAGEGSSITVTRTSSLSSDVATGKLSNGADIYYGDVLTIVCSALSGYEIATATLNGGALNSPHTVVSNVVIVTTAEQLCVAFIDNGTALEEYDAFIENGVQFHVYDAYRDNGTGWDILGA